MICNTLPSLFTAALILSTLVSTPAVAQDAASTLVRLTERSQSIVQAKVLRVETAGTAKRVLFRVQRTLRGTQVGSFLLAEPAGRACGRALHGVITSGSYLIFLAESSNGGRPATARLTIASSRAVIHVDPDTLAHVGALVGARSARERSTLLTIALTSRNQRIRRDAALALPIRAGLETASVADHDRVVAALQNALLADDHVALGLIRTATRLRLRAATPMLLRTYLSGKASSLTQVMREAIVDLDGAFAVQQIERSFPSDTKTQARAIELLERCPGPAPRAALVRLSGSPQQAVAVLAEQSLDRRDAQTTHLFRNIRPQRRSTGR